ncbi:hypothetical protein [Halotalea alkalilenta]|uniref:hypothetical protein n=1 Tax=Halotalea alkalilenta TaxID=376489 RepID=UPI0012DCF62C|nr:hypothetical protein [Halotalea alkalilenta]
MSRAAKRRVWPIALALALGSAAVIAAASDGRSYAQRLLHLELSQRLPSLSSALEGESDAVKIVFIAYAEDEPLWLNARLALLKYGDDAREPLAEQGLEPEFQHALREYGPDMLLPVIYFRQHGYFLSRWKRQAESGYQTLAEWWRDEVQPGEVMPDEAALQRADGARAVEFVNDEGYDFIQQFTRNPASGEIDWLNTERISRGMTNLLLGDTKRWEALRARGEEVPSAVMFGSVLEMGSLGLLAAGPAIKALSGGSRMARWGIASRSPSAAATSSARASRVALAARRGVTAVTWLAGSRWAKVAGGAALAYLVIKHPTLLNGVGNALAWALGIPAWLGVAAVWFCVLAPLYCLARPFLRLLGGVIRSCLKVSGWVRRSAVSSG